jgi:hypothetical protein
MCILHNSRLKILMAKRLVSVQGTCRGFVEVLEPLLYERCQGETHKKSPKISPTFPRRKWSGMPELDLAFSVRQCYFFSTNELHILEYCTKFFINITFYTQKLNGWHLTQLAVILAWFRPGFVAKSGFYQHLQIEIHYF